MSVLFLYATHAADEYDPYPLRPADTSSPRGTLNSFLTNFDKAIEAWQTGQPLAVRIRNFDRSASTFDTSEMSESDLHASKLKAALLLKEILDRIAVPPDDQIPGDDDIGSGDQVLANWTIPDTAITIAPVTEGPRASAYLFAAETLDHVEQYCEEAKHLPYKPRGDTGDL